MSGNPGYETLVERLRAELADAEEEFRQATTPEVKQYTLGRYEELLARYSDLVLRKRPASAAGSE
jgi:hypothetical protein